MKKWKRAYSLCTRYNFVKTKYQTGRCDIDEPAGFATKCDYNVTIGRDVHDMELWRTVIELEQDNEASRHIRFINS